MADIAHTTDLPNPSRRGVLFYSSALATGCLIGNALVALTPVQSALAAHRRADAIVRALNGADDDAFAAVVDVESAALERLALAPCKDDGEYFAKLKYLLDCELKAQGCVPDMSIPFGSVLVAAQLHLKS